MNKNILSVLFIAFALFLGTCTTSYGVTTSKINANAATKTIPQGTILKVKLKDPVGTQHLSVGAPFTVSVMDDIKEGKKIVIPQGTLIRGTISYISRAKMFSKGAVLGLDFDHIVSPNGKQISVDLALCNNAYLTLDGKLSSKTNYGTAIKQNATNAKNIVTKSTTWAWEKGDSVLNGYPKYVFAPVTAVVSAPVAGIYFIGDGIVDMFKKGDEIVINQGEILFIYTLKSFDMPVY